ncbi:hypothetical protein N0V93_001878 [Gnomoniopsis smithogilvyi]|uniref:Uncharacterized protein n=1 Tax=Gnomoniopsis smithogilvyi TaxID=1191159 RepID=A0A9W8Z4Q0_9PEZI|nr:hypothetical protein N0V93_001878 [Gnomoniopsis smithogilvyi]
MSGAPKARLTARRGFGSALKDMGTAWRGGAVAQKDRVNRVFQDIPSGSPCEGLQSEDREVFLPLHSGP